MNFTWETAGTVVAVISALAGALIWLDRRSARRATERIQTVSQEKCDTRHAKVDDALAEKANDTAMRAAFAELREQRKAVTSLTVTIGRIEERVSALGESQGRVEQRIIDLTAIIDRDRYTPGGSKPRR